MSSFTSPLVVSPMSDGRRWRLVKSFTYRIGKKYSRHFIKVPRDFETDFASIPKFIFWLFPWWAKFNKASVLHDWLYKAKIVMGNKVTREQTDDIFYEAMLIDYRHHKSGKFIAFIEYRAVRLFGFVAW